MIKAIETKYNGYSFRSRTEAKWAYVFDKLNIKYLYENEGYELENGDWYLPDFYLPNHGFFIEIKGSVFKSDHRIINLCDNFQDFYEAIESAKSYKF